MPILRDVSLRPFSYYQTGGTCSYFLQPHTVDELVEALKMLRPKNLPLFVLGGGTNSLVSDSHWDGVVVHLGLMKNITLSTETSLLVQAGATNSEVAVKALEQGLQGAAWMYRLPGQLGGTVRMNARCYGGEISQVVREVVSVDHTGQLTRWCTTPEEKNVFQGYKKTVFMQQPQIITEVLIKLEHGNPKAIQDEMNFCENDRVSKHQFDYPSCGCVFKNHYIPGVSVPSGKLIEMAGMKGMRHNGAVVSEFHANFIYNDKSATSQDIWSLSQMVRKKVLETSGIELEYEMEVLGNPMP
jgi:UDP-N-acetylmuramate dehydrogenase